MMFQIISPFLFDFYCCCCWLTPPFVRANISFHATHPVKVRICFFFFVYLWLHLQKSIITATTTTTTALMHCVYFNLRIHRHVFSNACIRHTSEVSWKFMFCRRLFSMATRCSVDKFSTFVLFFRTFSFQKLPPNKKNMFNSMLKLKSGFSPG